MADNEIQPGATREERDQLKSDLRDARVERDTDTILRSQPTPVTAVDALGVERIVTTTYGYDAPQVDPDPKEVARLAALQTRLDNQKQERLKQLTDAPDGSAAVAADAFAAEANTGTASTPAPSTTPAASTTSTSSASTSSTSTKSTSGSEA